MHPPWLQPTPNSSFSNRLSTDYCPIGQDEHHQMDFSNLSVIPPKEELLGHVQPQAALMKNRVNGEKYGNISEYLATHFFLLREDCTQALREAVQSLHDHRLPERQDIQVYRDVRLDFVQCGNMGVEYRMSFARGNAILQENSTSKYLMEGSLLCMSHDDFQTILWAMPSGQKNTSFDTNYVQVRCLDHISEAKLEFQKVYTVVESPSAYFEAYCHVLENLKKFQSLTLPFKEHFLYLEPQVKAPDYLCRDHDGRFLPSVDPNCVNFHVCASIFPLLQEWPELTSSLDPSQLKAVRHGITKRLALIQGPPGTGKTFVGKMIVKILLSNEGGGEGAGILPSTWEESWLNLKAERLDFRNVEESVGDSPLLVLCYTNHALDQFLEGIFEFEKSLIRYGGRSTSLKLIDCSVKQWIRKEKHGFLRLKWNQYRACIHKGDKLKRQISRCHALMRLEFVTIEPLRDVATREQIENLFFCGSDPNIVPLWLQGLDSLSAHRQLIHSSSSRCKDSNIKYPEIIHRQQVEDEDLDSCERNLDDPFVWALDGPSRSALHSVWLTRIRRLAEIQLSELSKEYQLVCSRKVKTNEELHSSVLRRAKVIGMTTTAASRCHSILMEVKPRVVVVEEAAEILEAHIIGCLTPFTEHLILIGDHLQLRPSVAINKLATDYHLDVSLFERLISGGVEHVTLEYQRRMRPEISRLLCSLYPNLKDHDCVFNRKNVEGIRENLFFLDHRYEERRMFDSKSKVNIEESLFVAELYLYLLKQGSYGIQDITILTMYRAQMECIKNVINKKLEELRSSCKIISDILMGPWSSQVACVDDYQGEESEIVILSLVRNIFPGKDMESIGFLENPNRVCVALSRARKGLYIFGNADLLASKSKLWQEILDDLRMHNGVGNCLTLVCPNHFLTETKIYNANGFHQAIEGGCSQRCQHVLDCGHQCPKTCHPGGHDHIFCLKDCSHTLMCGHPCPKACHPGGHEHIVCLEQCSHTLICGHRCLKSCHSGSHEKVICPKRCNRSLECGHQCMQRCHGTTRCPPCRQIVSRRHPQCHHQVLISCSFHGEFQCEEQCSSILNYGHECPDKYGKECTTKCLQMVTKKLPCGHFMAVPCYQPLDSVICEEVCGQSLKPLCNHFCQGRCSSCWMKKSHPKCSQGCERMLPCGHHCKSLCFESCQPCTEPCENKCSHRQCKRKCGEPCEPCEEPCEWSCEHYRCNLKCYEVCTRPRCDKRCPKVLNCGHDCIGLCGEPCPRCRICHPHTIEIFFQVPLQEIRDSTYFVQLSDCGHLAGFNDLDDFMDKDAEKPAKKWLKSCPSPSCDTPIRNTVRYKSITNSMLRKLEDIKQQIVEENFWSMKNLRRDNAEGSKGCGKS